MKQKPKYAQGELNTPAQHHVNSIIMEIACDLAGKLTEQECKRKKIKVFQKVDGETSYTEDAQDIFNSLYDEKMDEVYSFANTIKGAITHEKLSNHYGI